MKATATQTMAHSGTATLAGVPRLALRLASLIGRRQFRKVLDDGWPQFLVPPFLFLLNGRVNSEDYPIVKKIEDLRSELAKRENEFVTVFSDPSFISQSQSPRPVTRSLAQVARVSSVLPVWGLFLHLCANASRAKTILELGSSAGMSGCYLASGNYCQKFITIEGSATLANLADNHLRQISNRCQVVNASFDDGLDKIFPNLTEGIDLAYIDGNKEKAANLRYLERLTPHLNPGSVVVLDDIHWSHEMREAWKRISRLTGFSHTINAGRFGVCVWSGRTVQPKNYALYKIAGVDLYEVKQCFERMKTWLPKI
jgi:predicted O-methyltransferase YrrM